MSFVKDDWFVRASVTQELEYKILDIAEYVLKVCGDKVVSDDVDLISGVVADAAASFLNVASYTREEMEYVIKNIVDYCYIAWAFQKGVLIPDPNGCISFDTYEKF